MLHIIRILAGPALIEYGLSILVTYVDYIMVGSLGVKASATVGLTTEVNFLLKGSMTAMGIGFLSYISISLGANVKDKVKIASQQAIYLAIIMGLVEFMIAMIISPYLPIWLGADVSIQKDASLYFSITFAPILFFSLNTVLGSVLKAAGDMKTPMKVNIIINIINVILNFFLIYKSRRIVIMGISISVFGADFGVLGAGIATSISIVCGGILMTIGLFKNEVVSPKGIKLKIDKEILKKCISVSIPVMLSRITNSFGRVIFTALVAGLGTINFAAHTLAFTAESAFYIPVVGFSVAVITLAGNITGEKDVKKLHKLTVVASQLVGSIMVVMGILLFIFARQIISIFTDDNQVIEIGASLLRIVSINEPVFAISIVLESVFQGSGDTKSPFIVSTITLWTVRVLGAYICLQIFGFGIKSAWICMICENASRCLLLFLRYIKKHGMEKEIEKG